MITVGVFLRGLSTDPKPVAAAGTLFFEEDTGSLYQLKAVAGSGFQWSQVQIVGDNISLPNAGEITFDNAAGDGEIVALTVNSDDEVEVPEGEAFRVSVPVIMTDLPEVDPEVLGALYIDTGALMVSAGPP